MTDYTHINQSIKATLVRDSWIGNSANVKTIEDFKREFSLQGDDDKPFYKDSELPAMAIDSKAGGKEQNLETVGEIRENIFSEITIISGDADAQTAEINHNTIIQNLERVLEAQITSIQDLGLDALVKDVATDPVEPFKKANKTYYFSRTTLTLDITQSLELAVYGDDEPGFENTDAFF